MTESEQKAFDQTLLKGKEGGLFQECLKAIRSQHDIANQMRAALVVAGLFTDQSLYREAISTFYAVTKVAEKKLYAGNGSIEKKLQALGYRFTELYEKDLSWMLGDEWQTQVDMIVSRNPAVENYIRLLIESKTSSDLAGAVFALWGALVIGGGAAAMPRVKKLMGNEATHLFRPVAGPNRDARRTEFAQVWDSLAEQDDPEFKSIQIACKQYMDANNQLLIGMKAEPYWYSWTKMALQASVVAGISIFLFSILKR